MNTYRYYQNNSGGGDDEDLPKLLFVEANSADEANTRAVSIGVYFDGCDSGEDCDCCGDRWARASESDAGTPAETEGYEWAQPWGILRSGSSKWEPVSK